MAALRTEEGYRNSLEAKVADQLKKAGVKFEYEKLKLPISHAPRIGRYTPDFSTPDCPVIIEVKGYFYNSAADRKNLILAKEQHPHLEFRLVFQNASTKIYKGSKTTYGKWATDHGFLWSDKGIVPDKWTAEITAKQRSTHDTRKRTASKSSKQAGPRMAGSWKAHHSDGRIRSPKHHAAGVAHQRAAVSRLQHRHSMGRRA